MFTTGETVGLAEWIIDGTCLVLSAFPKTFFANNLVLACRSIRFLIDAVC